jgi:hypothetical protein
MTPNSCPAWSSAASAVNGAGVFDRLLGRLIAECESFGLATTMVIPSGLALDVQGAFVKALPESPSTDKR